MRVRSALVSGLLALGLFAVPAAAWADSVRITGDEPGSVRITGDPDSIRITDDKIWAYAG